MQAALHGADRPSQIPQVGAQRKRPGRVKYGDVTLRKSYDASSPSLAEACANGVNLAQLRKGEVDVYSSGRARKARFWMEGGRGQSRAVAAGGNQTPGSEPAGWRARMESAESDYIVQAPSQRTTKRPSGSVATASEVPPPVIPSNFPVPPIIPHSLPEGEFQNQIQYMSPSVSRAAQ